MTCPGAERPFPVVGGTPVLVDFTSSVVSLERLRADGGSSPFTRRGAASTVRRRLGGYVHPWNAVAERGVAQILRLLRAERGERRPVVLIVGGGEIGAGTSALYEADDVDVLAFDIYVSPFVQLVADGHRIPLRDERVDAIVIQAVLEHVLEPSLVVSEIRRVLRPNGIVYADTPFLQQVHEGPYDFTRFTESGHRYLFRDFERIESGAVAGAGTQLAWSIDYFVRALARSRSAGLLARLAVSWLCRLDPLLDPRFSLDGASSVYFLGRKSTRRLSAAAIVAHYQGAQ